MSVVRAARFARHALAVACVFTMFAGSASAGGTDPPPRTGIGNTFNPLPNQSAAQARNVAVLVHGYKSDPAEWANAMGAKLVTALGGDANKWDIFSYDWSQDASASGNFAPIHEDFMRAQAQGQALAWNIAHALGDHGGYTNVHLMGHSLGGRVIETAATYLQQLKINDVGTGAATIHTTFFDAFTPLGWNMIYGSTSNWSEHYFHRKLDGFFGTDDFALTENVFPSARSVDVTRVRPSTDPRDDGQGHSWPYRWYSDTITSPNVADNAGQGFNLSREADVTGWPRANTGRVIQLRPGQAALDFPAEAVGTVNLATLDLGAEGVICAQSGATVDSGVISLEPLSGGSAWINLSLEITQPINFLDYKFNFSDTSMNQLSVRVDNELVDMSWDAYRFTNLLNGTWEYSGKIMLLPLSRGEHTLSFRFDNLDAEFPTTIAKLTEIRTGLIPEPGMLGMVCVIAILAMRRRIAKT